MRYQPVGVCLQRTMLLGQARLARWKQAFQVGFDQQGSVLGIHAGRGKSAAGDVETLLGRPRIHVLQFAVGAYAPDRADAVGDIVTEHGADRFLERLIAGREYQHIHIQTAAVPDLSLIFPSMMRSDAPTFR